MVIPIKQTGVRRTQMDDERTVLKFLKWVGVVALVSLPLVVLLRNRKSQNTETFKEDESDIFASELRE